MTRRALVLLALASCGDGRTLQLVVDVPAPSSPAYPYTDLDALELSIAHAGASGSLVLRAVERGETPELPNVPFADDLVLHLSGSRTGVEVAYGRSCVFAVTRDMPLPPAPHVYFSRIVKWAPGPAPLAPGRTGGDAYTAPDGSAVFVGGGDETRIERFDAAAARFEAAGVSVARDGAAVAPLPDGGAVRVGGAVAGVPVGFFEILSPFQGRVETVNDDRLRLVDHAAVTLVDGSVLVIGGRAPAGGSALEVSGATFSLRPNSGEPSRLMPAVLATPRARHTLTRLGDDVGAAVLVAGGQDATGAPVAASELYEPLREDYAAFHPPMVRPRWDHRAVRLPDGSVLIVGGRDAAGPVDVLELYRPLLGQFVEVGRMPPAAGLTELTATPLPDGRVLLAGGRDASGKPVSVTLIARLDPVDGTVDLSQTDPLAVPRAGHAAALLCDGTVLVVGGAQGASVPGSERYNPPSADRR